MAGLMNRPERRRGEKEHGLKVQGVGLRVVCLCGRVISLRRSTDVREVSLDDLLGLVRSSHGNS